MNKVILIGRLTKEPEVRYTRTGDKDLCISRFTLAVDRRKSHNGNEKQTADFISCVAFGKQAEFTEKYTTKGTKIALTGHIQTGSYTNQGGIKVYTTDVVVDELEFAESKNSGSSDTQNTQNSGSSTSAPDGDYMNIPDGIDEELPFN